MGPTISIGQAEREYLRMVCELAGGEAKVPVAFHEVQEALALAGDESERRCDFWTRRGALEWPAFGHVALTHSGLAQLAGWESLPGPADTGTAYGGDSESARVSVVIPVHNEARTIDGLVRGLCRSPQVLEVIVVDDGSIDDTAALAAAAGARVVTSSLLGKGASMEDGVREARGDIVLFVDGDLSGLPDEFVTRMTKPLVVGEADLVKAGFTRDAAGVTQLTAQPLLSAFFPDLDRFCQPLCGMVATRRSFLRNLTLENDYGVDVALLIDAAQKGAKLTEVHIGHIAHESQPPQALSDMARQVTRVILDRAWRYERLSINRVIEMREAERRAGAGSLPFDLPVSGEQKYALFDMDGVLLDGRFVVELAEHVGASDDVHRLLDSHILPDEERSRAIAALFAGVPWETFVEVARDMPLMEGAVETVIALRRAGYVVGIVTDSFHVAAETIRRRIFADFCVAHVLHFRNGTATGELTLAPLMHHSQGCRQHVCCKANVLRHLNAGSRSASRRILAVGHGENDLCMLRAAGTSVAFRAQSKQVGRAAQHQVSGPLTQILGLLDRPAVTRVRVSRSQSSAARLPAPGRATAVPRG